MRTRISGLTGWWPLVVLVPALALAADQGSPDLPAPADFSNLSMEQLSAVKITSVAKKQQALSRVAAAVYVITGEDIHRSGLTSVADLLRLAPGVTVARLDASKWAVTARGFSGRFANKLLVLIDGRSVYTPIFSGVYWDMSMPPLDDIERIEVIRGPGATMWGSNAVNGVINIITRNARDTRGGSVTVAAGPHVGASGEVQVGGEGKGGFFYRAYGQATDVAQLSTQSGQGAGDGWSAEQTGFRLDGGNRKDSWTLEGDLYRNRRVDIDIEPNLAAGGFVRSPGSFTGESANLSGEWRRQTGENSDLRVKGSFDYTGRPESAALEAITRTYNLELQYHVTINAHHDVTLGVGENVASNDLSPGVTTDTGVPFTFSPSSLAYSTFNTFVQDEIALPRNFTLTLGAKLEKDYFSGWELQPGAQLLWEPSKKQSVWVSVDRAVRTPALYESDVTAPLFVLPGTVQTGGLPVVLASLPSTQKVAESLRSYELGYRVQVSPRFSVDATAFFNQYADFRSLYPIATNLAFSPLPHLVQDYVYGNASKGSGQGAELAAVWHPRSWWKLSSSYSWLEVHTKFAADAEPDSVNVNATVTPVHQWKTQSYWNLSKKVQFDAFLYYASATEPSAFGTTVYIPSYTRADVRLGWSITSKWEVSVSGQNLLGGRHLEMIPEDLTAPSYVVRGGYLKSIWRF